MKKLSKIIIMLFIILFLVSCKKDIEVKNELPQEIYSIPLGDYQDSLSQRATMKISFKNKVYVCEINWANSASINVRWNFSGVFDPDVNGIVYTNEICTRESYDDAGVKTEVEVYNGGKGVIVYKGEKVYWVDEQEVKNYDEYLNGIFEKIENED